MALVKDMVFVSILRLCLSPCNKASFILKLSSETKQLFYSRSFNKYTAKPNLKCPVHTSSSTMCTSLKQQELFLEKTEYIVFKPDYLNSPEDTTLYKEIPL